MLQIGYLIVTLILAGFLTWLINSAPFINAWFKSVIIGVICIACLLYVLSLFGVPMPFHLHR